MSKILLINGSPRKMGLTNALLTVFMNKIIELNEGDKHIQVDIIHLSNFKVEHCNGCDICLKKPNTCPLSEKDDMLNLEARMKSADAIIIGSPSYFGNISGLVKVLFDRSRPMKMQKYQLKDKIFSFVSASGLPNGGNNWVHDALIHWALIHGLVVISALGHPVIMGNFPGDTLQMESLKEFRKISEPGEISVTVIKELAKRVFGML